LYRKAGCVDLQLMIGSSRGSDVVVPLGGIGQARVVKFVGPNELIVLRPGERRRC
jgi:hypothetical protein